MTQIHWLSQVNGLFTTAADWGGGKVPKSGDDALIDAAGAVNYTVTSAGAVNAHSLALGATATLSITANVFDLLNGTGAGANAGAILIGDGARLEFGGVFDNAGLITLSGATKSTTFFIGAAGATLDGGGSLVLAGPTSSVLAINAATVLINVDNTISGAGQLGNGKLTLVNDAAGVVDANATGALLVNTAGSTLTNAGLMEAVGAGGLTIRNTTVDDSGGGTIAAAGGQVRLQSAHVIGGVLTSSGAGAVHATSGSTVLDGGAGSLANQGRVIVDNGQSLTIAGDIANSGTIVVNAGTTATSISVGAAGATLSGGGKITLANVALSRITGVSAAATLTNVDNTISGAGQLGLGSLTLINQAKGVINASGPVALVLNTKGENLVNAGLIEGTGTGGLSIVNTTLDDTTGGTIFAGAGSAVTLTAGILEGGALTTKGTGVITTVGRLSMLDGSAASVSNQGTVVVADNTSLILRGAIANSGRISLAAAGYTTQLLIDAAGATLSGGGNVALSVNGANQIRSTAAATLTNVDNTISGTGSVGNGLLTIVNQAAGVINANQSQAMTLSTPGHAIVNAGLIEGTGTGGLAISTTTISGAGVIKAGNGSAVTLTAATISGGTLATAGTGVISAAFYASVLDGTSTHPVTVIGAVKVAAGAALTVQGSVALSQTVGTTTTKGTISLAGAGLQSHLIIGAAGATFSGAGSISMGDSPNNLIAGPSASAVSKLTNSATITGAGWIGSSLSLINTGVIDATGANALLIQTGNYSVPNAKRVTNTGLLEATNPNKLAATGGLSISGDTLSGAGTIEASGTAAHVDLYNSTISGQTFVTASGGAINATGFGDLLDGTAAPLTNLGTISVSGGRLNVQGTIAGTGVIAVGKPGSSFTGLAVMAAGATLTGGGGLVLSDGTLNFVYAFTGVGTLTNAGDTISGAGQFGSSMGLVNGAGGVINANGTHVLALEGTTLTNAGLVEDTGAGGLQIGGSAANSGTILSAGSGGVALYGGIANSGLVEAQSGLLRLDDSIFNSATGAVKVDAGGQAHLFGGAITGGALSIAAGGTLAVSYTCVVTPLTFTNQGEIDVLSGGVLRLKGSVNNSGAIDVGVGGANGRIAVAGPAVTLGGGGGVVLADSNQSYIYNYNGLRATLVNLDNTISGAGQISGYYLTLINKAAGVIDANGANFLYIGTGGNTITNAGLIEATGAGGLGLYSTVSNSGTILAGGAGSLTLRKSVINSGVVEASGGTLVLNADTVTNTAIGSVGAVSGTVELESAVVKGGGLFTGVGGTIAIASYAAVATATVTNKGTIAVATGARLELAGSVNNSGLIAVGAAGGYGSLGLLSGVTLSGGGTLALADSAQSRLYGPGGGVTLTNAGDTILGGGTITQSVRLNNKAGGVVDANGKNQLRIGGIGYTLVNAGLVEATGAGGLYVVGDIANSGTLAANGGALTVYGGTVVNTGSALVSVAAASELELYVAAVTGGAVSVAAGGTLKVDVGAIDQLTPASLVNQGTVTLAAGVQLHVQGAFNNSGAIDIGGTGGSARLGVLAGGLTLSGGGSVVMADYAGSNIYAVSPGARLVNVSDTITGAGDIQGALGLTNQAAGVIDATGAKALYLGTAYDILNAGLIENTGAGGLDIQTTVVTNSGRLAANGGTLTLSNSLVTQTALGTVSVAAGADLQLDSSNVIGGVVSVAAGGEIAVSGHAIIRPASFTNAGTVAVANGGSLELQGTVNNSGAIDVGPPGGNGRLGVEGAGVELTGGGAVVLGDNVLSRIYATGAGGTLTNVDNVISGAGYIGNGNALALVNQAAGTIEATGSHVLTLSTGANVISNAGLIEDLGTGNLMIRSSLSNSGTILADGSAGVIFYGAVANSRTLEAKSGYLDFVGLTITNTGTGLLKADAGATVDVVNFAEVLGGTVDTEAGGKFAIYGSDYVEAATFTNKGTVQVAANSTLITQGRVNNTGAIDIGAAGGPGQINILGAGLTLAGAGQFAFSDNSNNSIRTSSSATFTNVNNTITGAGYIGGSSLNIDNQLGGVIDATGAQLLVLGGGFNTFTNEGLVETSGTSSLADYAPLTNSGRVLANSSGTLKVNFVSGNSGTLEAAKGVLALFNGVNNTPTGVVKADKGATITTTQFLITGGLLSIAAGGYLDNASKNVVRLTPATFTNKGTIEVNAGKLLTSGQVANSGLIELGNGGSLGVLVAGATLSGGGVLDIGDSASSLVYAYNGLTTLTNASGTIRGGGTIGGQLFVVNLPAGVIDGDGTNALVFGPNMPVITNGGLIESTSSGGVTLAQDSVVGGGTIAAFGAGSHVDVSFTTIVGQTLATTGGGVINVTGASDLFDGSTASVTNNGSVSVGSGATLHIEGAIAGNGVIALASGVNYSDLLINTPGATLTGGGTISLGGGGQDYIFSYGGAATLTNAGDTIVGAGLIGDANLVLTNQAAGVIDATGFVGVNARTLSNAGLMEATGSGRLDVRYSLANSGTVLASGALAEVDLYGGVGNSGVLSTASAGSLRVFGTVTNTATATVNIDAGSGLILSNASVLGGVVSVKAGGQIVAVSQDTLEAATLTNAGTVLVFNSSTLTLDGDVNNSGAIKVGSGAGFARIRLDGAGLTLSGGGSVTLTNNPNSYIQGSGGQTLVNVDNTISGSGRIQGTGLAITNQAAGVIDASGYYALYVSGLSSDLTNAGLMEATGYDGLFVFGTVSNSGTLAAIGSKMSLSTVSNTATGVVIAEAGSTVRVNAAVTGGILATDAGGTLATVGNVTLEVATLNNLGTIDVGDPGVLVTAGYVNNAGVINLGPAGGVGRMKIDSAGLTLGGGGVVNLADHPTSYPTYIYAGGGAATLTNASDTLQGAGVIGNGDLTLINQAGGVIDANAADSLLVQTALNTITNAGLMEATGAGGLFVYGVVANSGTLSGDGGVLHLNTTTIFNGPAGVVTAASGYGVSLDAGLIIGGTVSTAAGATLVASGVSAIEPATLNNQGTLQLANYAYLYLDRAVNNSGVINVGPSGGYATLDIDTDGLTLTGGGSVVLSDNTASRILTPGGGALINTDNTLSGGGTIGGNGSTITNQASGVIDATGVHVLFLASSGQTIVNAGLMEATYAGGAGLTVNAQLDNTGTIAAAGGNVLVIGDVSGAGVAVISAGTLHTESAFSQNVTFTGTAGELDLDHALLFTGTISGFSHTGGTSLDLGDVGFVSSGEATFSGTTAGGVLTVSDGTNVAQINLLGDYTGATFVASSDGNGGVMIVDPTATHLTSAIASFAPSAANPTSATAPPATRLLPTLASTG